MRFGFKLHILIWWKVFMTVSQYFWSSWVHWWSTPIGMEYLNQRSLRDSTILYGVCVGEMLVLKAICDALTHWLTVQKALLARTHPPPPPPKKKNSGSFTAFNTNVRVGKICHMRTKFRQIIPFWSKLLLQLDTLWKTNSWFEMLIINLDKLIPNQTWRRWKKFLHLHASFL